MKDNLTILQKHDSSYEHFMLAGLNQALNGISMPGLDEELEVQKTLSLFK